MAIRISNSKGFDNDTFDTYVPDLDDSADIQKAFELFYYGNSEDGNAEGDVSLHKNIVDFDNRITSNTSGLSGHIGNTTTAHGATGAVVGTTNTQTLTNKSLLYTISAAKTGAYTLAAGDESKLTELNGTFTVTIPLDSTYNFPIGSTIDVVNIGTGVITTAGTSGVTLNGTPGLKLRSQWSAASFIKRAANTWLIVGDLTA
jgi:hypothetical protein